MMTQLLNLSTPSHQRRWVCVLDPSLVLSHYGLTLAKQLGEVMNLWMARELWHILKNTHFYLQQPETLLSPALQIPTSESQIATQGVVQALLDWQMIQRETHPNNLNLFWLGDSFGESFLPGGTDPQLLSRWEFLAHSLEAQIPSSASTDCTGRTGETLAVAVRDTIALTAALEPAFVLTYQPSLHPLSGIEDDCPPHLCTLLEQWGVSCQAIAPDDALLAIERERLWILMTQVGLSKWLWSGLRLAVLHLIPPPFSTFSFRAHQANVSPLGVDTLDSQLPPWPTDWAPYPWHQCQGFWYWL
jgi:hypothetical protein